MSEVALSVSAALKDEQCLHHLDLAETHGWMDDFNRWNFQGDDKLLDFVQALTHQLEEKHMAEIATLEHEIKLVRARNQRLEEEIAWIENVGK